MVDEILWQMIAVVIVSAFLVVVIALALLILLYRSQFFKQFQKAGSFFKEYCLKNIMAFWCWRVWIWLQGQERRALIEAQTVLGQPNGQRQPERQPGRSARRIPDQHGKGSSINDVTHFRLIKDVLYRWYWNASIVDSIFNSIWHDLTTFNFLMTFMSPNLQLGTMLYDNRLRSTN